MENYSDDFKVDATQQEPFGVLNLRPQLRKQEEITNESMASDDPFAEIEQSFEKVSLQGDISREQRAQLSQRLQELMEEARNSANEKFCVILFDEILLLLKIGSNLRTKFVELNGLILTLEILEGCVNEKLAHVLLQILDYLVQSDETILFKMGLFCGVTIVSRFFSTHFEFSLRQQVAVLLDHFCQSTSTVLQMFLSCGGFEHLAQMIQSDYKTCNRLVDIGVYGLWRVISSQVSSLLTQAS